MSETSYSEPDQVEYTSAAYYDGNPDSSLECKWTNTIDDPFAVTCELMLGNQKTPWTFGRELLRDILDDRTLRGDDSIDLIGEGDVCGISIDSAEGGYVDLHLESPDGSLLITTGYPGLRTFLNNCYDMINDAEAQLACDAALDRLAEKL